jgi:hypothetical protein
MADSQVQGKEMFQSALLKVACHRLFMARPGVYGVPPRLLRVRLWVHLYFLGERIQRVFARHGGRLHLARLRHPQQHEVFNFGIGAWGLNAVPFRSQGGQQFASEVRTSRNTSQGVNFLLFDRAQVEFPECRRC